MIQDHSSQTRMTLKPGKCGTDWMAPSLVMVDFMVVGENIITLKP